MLRDQGPLSRVDLAEQAGVSRTTIAAEIAKLEQLGLVGSAGRGQSRGGAPSGQVSPARSNSCGVHGNSLVPASITLASATITKDNVDDYLSLGFPS